MITPPASSEDATEPDLYIEDFSEFIRDLLRAVAADDNSRALSNASARLRNLVAHHSNLPQELSWYRILERAVNALKPPHEPFDSPMAYEKDFDRIGKYGVKLLAELTTTDGLSEARISKARQAVAAEIASIDSRRKLRRDLRQAD